MKRVSAIILVFLIIILPACSKGSEMPEIKISCGGLEIESAAMKIEWEGKTFDDEELFKALIKGKEISELQYFALGEEITIEFLGGKPDSYTLTEHLLTNGAVYKYSIREDREIKPEENAAGLSFKLSFNPASMLSSQLEDYEKGASLRGFRLRCEWGENSGEYAFLLRSDSQE